MDKKYQIFVSSTYEDLKEERNAIKDSPRLGWVRADIVEKLGKNSDEINHIS